MAKSHVVKLTITNSTGYKLTDPNSWFDSGRVADGWDIPNSIDSGTYAIIEMYEKDWVWAGCSGYITYSINTGRVTIAFSNPSTGSNKLGCGIYGKQVWNDMESHDYKPFSNSFTIRDVNFTAKQKATGGSVNQATVELFVPDD